MKIYNISSVLPKTAKTLYSQNFNGYWGKTYTVGAPYPYEGHTQEVCPYYPDRDETIDEIESVYKARSNRSIGSYPYPSYRYMDTYTVGGINYRIDDRRSWELRKAHLTYSADKAEQQKEYLQAIRYRIRIANILAKQGKQRDQYLVEQSIRNTYKQLERYDKAKIEDEILEYNPDVIWDLVDSIKYV